MARKTLIATLEIGKIPYARYSRPLLLEYAETTNSDVFVISDNWEIYGRHLYANKFQAIHKFLEGDYERLLYVDADVLIKPNAPNIFEGYGSGFWAAPAPGPSLKRRYLRGLQENFYSIPNDFDRSTYPNGGVFLFDRQSASRLIAGLGPPYLFGVLNDQGTIHWAAYRMGLRINKMFYQWNCLLRCLSEVADPFFLHVDGPKKGTQFEDRLKMACHENPKISKWVGKLW